MSNAIGHSGRAIRWMSDLYDRLSTITPISAQPGRAINQRATPMSKHNADCGNTRQRLVSASASARSGTRSANKKAREEQRKYESFSTAGHAGAAWIIERRIASDQFNFDHQHGYRW